MGVRGGTRREGLEGCGERVGHKLVAGMSDEVIWPFGWTCLGRSLDVG